MANRQQRQDQQQQRGRNPMQTSPERDEETGRLPTDGKRRALQASQEREAERLAQAGEEDEDADDDLEDDNDDEDDEDDTISPAS